VTARTVVAGIIAFIAAPFLITGLFRLGVEGFIPFALLLLVSAGAWLWRRRAVAVGLALGTVAWAAALVVILSQMGSGGSFS
jgi:hypothetical protein